MRYIVDFSIAAFIYLSITAAVYFRQPKVPRPQGRVYGALLILGLATLVLDVAAAVMDAYGSVLPTALLYAINILFLLCTQVMGYLFFLYALMLLGMGSRRKRALAGLPVLFVAAGLLASPFTRDGFFWIDEMGAYQHGTTHMLLYAVSAMYLLTAIACVIYRRHEVRQVKRYTMFAFVLFTLTAMLVQIAEPNVLVNSTATALALTMMYHALESPSEHSDALTGAFNSTGLTIRVQDLFEQRQRFTLLGFVLDSLPAINETLGERKGDEVLVGFCQALRPLFPHGEISRSFGNVFTVLLAEPVDHQKLDEAYRRVGEAWRARGDTSLVIWCYGVNSEICANAREMLGMYHILTEEQALNGETVLFVDEERRKRQRYNEAVEQALSRALENDTLMVYYQPIHDECGALVALEALARLEDEKLGFISPDLFVRIAEQNGSIHQLGEAVLRKVFRFVSQNGLADWGLEHIGVNLSVAQCMADGLAERLDAIANETHVSPRLFGLEVTETAVASSLPMVRQNLLALAQRGYRFLLDDFGSGNANFNYILHLPIFSVKIDKGLLWGVEDNEKQRAFLTGVCTLLKNIGMQTVCEGVETEAHRTLLRELRVDQLQGYLFSKPLPPEKLLAYAAPYIQKSEGSEAGT